MKQIDLNSMLKKIDDYQLIPFLEEMVNFVRDIKPTLESINVAIAENIKKMPNATQKLSQVTQATENATTEIMNVIDTFFIKLDNAQKILTEFIDKRKSQRDFFIDLLEKIQPVVAGNSELSAGIEEGIKQANQIYNDDIQKYYDELLGYIDAINMDSTNIMMSLQVQDITSQQIAAVNHLLGTIQGKLGVILQRFKATELSSILNSDDDKVEEGKNVSHLHREIAFDPDAVKAISNKENRQNDVDDLISKVESGQVTEEDLQEDDQESMDIDDIDALFGNTNTADESTFSPDASDEEDPSDMSQDDIDALFG